MIEHRCYRIASRARAAAPFALAASLLLGALPAMGMAASSPGLAGVPRPLGPWAVKLDPRLLEAARLGATDEQAVWIEFTDKGERDPSDLAARLDAAATALTPRARARRERAKVWPLVDYLDLPMHEPYVATLRAQGFAPYGASRWFNGVALRIPATRLGEVASHAFVRALTPVEKARRTREVPTDDAGSLMPPPRAECPNGANCVNPIQANYGLTATEMALFNIPALHDSGYTGAGVLICMVDDGFDHYRGHEALKDIAVPPGHTRDFVWGIPNLPDSSTSFGYGQHGSHTLACAGGLKPGTFLGAAFGATFALARTEADSVERHVEMVYWGMGAEWADSLGADIVSSSLGYHDFDSPDPDYPFSALNGHTTIVTRAAQIAASKGILVVTAAGNEGNGVWKKISAPGDAHGDSVITVGAVDPGRIKTGFSSIGPTADGRIKPDLMAQGAGNPLPFLGNTPLNPSAYYSSMGTSFATPLIAGLAACLMQARPLLTPVQIVQALRASADRFTDPDTLYGYGIPDGGRAMQVTASTTSVPGPGVHIVLLGPNPLHPGQVATVRFAAGPGFPAAARAKVQVYDALGRRVRQLWCAESLPADRWITARWDGTDDGGDRVRPGLYFVNLEAGRERQSARIVYLR